MNKIEQRNKLGKNMIELSHYESYGNYGKFEGSVCINSEQFNSLPEEIQTSLSNESNILLETLREKINLAWAQCNENEQRDEHVEKLTSLFKDAGFEPIYVKIIENQYNKNPYYYKYPWIEVTTSKGIIILGWRKRVINIDWSKSDIDINGLELFKSETITVGKDYIHAWDYEKAIEYLKKLNSVKI